ncbi:MAG TPA: polymer-forming cytoskeletal protein [Bryobacteraceae bacterium]|nr:polymer-forming cytoskeletal protein [Bryobacteraceae bacterium]
MWSDRKQEPAKFSPALDTKPEPVPQRISSAPLGITIIGKAMVIRGEIRSREDLHVDGQVDGSLDVSNCRLTVGTSGRVGAGAMAREVDVLGSVNGDVEASKKITIRKGGRLVGDLRTPGIVIEDGAYFKGKIEIVNTDEAAGEASTSSPDAKPAEAKTSATGA